MCLQAPASAAQRLREGEADIELTGYTVKSFKPMQTKFLTALAAALGIDEKGGEHLESFP